MVSNDDRCALRCARLLSAHHLSDIFVCLCFVSCCRSDQQLHRHGERDRERGAHRRVHRPSRRGRARRRAAGAVAAQRPRQRRGSGSRGRRSATRTQSAPATHHHQPGTNTRTTFSFFSFNCLTPSFFSLQPNALRTDWQKCRSPFCRSLCPILPQSSRLSGAVHIRVVRTCFSFGRTNLFHRGTI